METIFIYFYKHYSLVWLTNFSDNGGVMYGAITVQVLTICLHIVEAEAIQGSLQATLSQEVK